MYFEEDSNFLEIKSYHQFRFELVFDWYFFDELRSWCFYFWTIVQCCGSDLQLNSCDCFNISEIYFGDFSEDKL